MKWQHYVLGYEQDAEYFIDAARNKGDATFIVGAGFDPRGLISLQRFVQPQVAERTRVLILDLPSIHQEHGPTHELAERNRRILEHLMASLPADFTRIAFPEVNDRLWAGLALSRNLQSTYIPQSGLVVVDVSSLPATVYFPIIGGLLEATRAGRFQGDIQVIVCENPEVDCRIVDEGSSDPGPIAGFNKGLTSEVGESVTKVWAPVIGERQGPQMDSIFQYLRPDEVCPVFPFPAMDARRADNLVLEHRELLFDRMEVEPRNFIYADESNPFDLYRTLAALEERYGASLLPLGRSKVVASVHASKTLSLGTLLAAWEYKLPVVTAGTTGYLVESVDDILAHEDVARIALLWLEGQPYR